MANKGRNVEVSTFRVPTEYERQAAEARRRSAMAQMLAQQQYVPSESNVAPIPAAAPLVQGIQAFMLARQLKKSQEAEEKAKGEETRTGEAIMNRLLGGAPLSTAPGPSSTDPLTGVTVESQFKQDPTEALRLASSPAGMAAMRGNPLLAATLQKSMEAPAAEEFYAPTETATGLVQFGKRGGKKETGLQAAPKDVSPTTLARLQQERASLPPGDPRIPQYDRAIESEIGSKAPVTNVISPKDTFRLEADLRGEYKDQLKEYQAVRDSYQKIEEALQTGAGDIAVVYAFAKLNDPTSVVRESEFETVAKSGSLGQRIKNLVEQAQTGKMNPELRENLRQQARQMYLARQRQAEKVAQQYRDLSTNYGLDPEKVLAGIDISNVAESEKIIDLPSRR